MTDIDETSQTLGRLLAGVEALQEGQKYDRIVRGELINKVQELSVDKDRLNAVEKLVDVHEQWRQRGIGVVMFVTLIAGVIGAVIAAAFEKFFGRN